MSLPYAAALPHWLLLPIELLTHYAGWLPLVTDIRRRYVISLSGYDGDVNIRLHEETVGCLVIITAGHTLAYTQARRWHYH